MTRRSPTTRATAAPRPLESIDSRILGGVIGGRMAPRTTLDPVLLQGIQQLSQAIMSVGQNMAAAKQAGSQQMMQLIQQMMQSRRR